MPKASVKPQDTDALLRDVVRLFSEAQRTMTDCCSDASAKECEALVLLGRTGAITVQEFAAQMHLEKTWASRLLTRLEKRGFVKRAAHPDDGRRWLIELTPAGKREHAGLQTGLNKHAANLLSCVPATRRAAVEEALTILRDALRECVEKC